MATMRVFIGLFWALGGMALGFALFAAGAALFAQVTQASNREGAIGYFVIALGIVGAVLGLVAGLGWVARSAPAGDAWSHLGQALLGLGLLAAMLGLVGWVWVDGHELPVKYGGETQANLELEFRIAATAAPAGAARQWLSVEVTGRKTRPQALVLQDAMRHEEGHLVVPAVQGPLLAVRGRLVVARLQLPEGERDVVFMPGMPRKPDAEADWSNWVQPREVFDPQAGAPAAAPGLSLRWRVRRYGS